MEPRIVNFINFIRGIEPRNPSMDLVLPVARQMELARKYDLPVTWLLQYDALLDKRFIELLKQAPPTHEIGGWFEVVEPQVKAAGLTWKGRYPWDWHCDKGFSVGYTPAEREKLVDVYMQKFKEVFGHTPASVGSWFIDAHTLGYMADRYGVVASCNCKDQRGTDGYTLWGGYYNQAYYPSRANSYMPAQTRENQIPVPVFRMLGSDPIYQYDAGEPGQPQPVVTLEPVYTGGTGGGGEPAWVRWFFDTIFQTPCLSFGYTQIGQENSFGWPGMEKGLTDQCAELARRVAKGEVRVETLESSGRWYRSRYELTPASAITALKDWKAQGRKSLWYASRFYRVNLLWQGDSLRVRDIHVFNERYAEPFLKAVCKSSSCTYDTLPVFDGGSWGHTAGEAVFAALSNPSAPEAFQGAGEPTVQELSPEALRVTWPLKQGGTLEILCEPQQMKIKGPAGAWGLLLPAPPAGTETQLVEAAGQAIKYRHKGFDYALTCQQGTPERTGKDKLLLRAQKQELGLEFK